MKDNEYKPYTARRWTDIPIPTVVGPAEEFTEEEKRKNREELECIMKKFGVLKPDESLK